ncbi:MAG TPA: hypothetical protein VHX88_21100 [Solirubrobacteraceae bacterium]|jgi:hypothetical protein|nr:hypothetical protein [Solirubrobacteraceae bacterium]
MPTRAQIEFFARWNEAARRADRAADAASSMEQRLAEAAELSSLASELRECVRSADSDVRSA